MYKAICPSCNEINNLTEADLGVHLQCGACGESFIFGAEIRRELKRQRAEKKKEDLERIKRAKREATAIQLAKKAEAKRQTEIVLAARHRADVVVVEARNHEQRQSAPAAYEFRDALPASIPQRRRTGNTYAIIALSLLGIIALSVSFPYLHSAISAMESPYSKEAKVLASEYRKLHANIQTGISVLSYNQTKQVALDSFHRLSAVATESDRSRDSFHKASTASRAIWRLQNALGEFAFEFDESRRLIMGLALERSIDEALRELESAAKALEGGN